MSREVYSTGQTNSNTTGTRSPGRSTRRLTELPTVDKSPSRDYGGIRGRPLGEITIVFTLIVILYCMPLFLLIFKSICLERTNQF